MGNKFRGGIYNSDLDLTAALSSKKPKSYYKLTSYKVSNKLVFTQAEQNQYVTLQKGNKIINHLATKFENDPILKARLENAFRAALKEYNKNQK